MTGRPGAGKTYETSKIIEQLHTLNEEVVILGPTDKAALRMTENIKANTSIDSLEAVTIDKFIYDSIYACSTDLRKLFASNIILLGENMDTPGFKEELENRVNLLMPHAFEVNVSVPDRPNLRSWEGASTVGTMDSFNHLFLQTSEYQSGGAKAIHLRAF